jgi:hypothetical protein
MWSVVACYSPEDGLQTETRVGECIDINPLKAKRKLFHFKDPVRTAQ